MHWSKGRVVSVLIAAMFVAGIGLGLSCSKRSGDTNAIANPEYVKPVGHVQGKVVDACTDLSIKDVEVSIAIKGSIKSQTTDTEGLFAFQNLPVNYGYTNDNGSNQDGDCYVVVANFTKYNKKDADEVKKWNKKYPNDLKLARPYPETVEGDVCLHYEWIESASSDGAVTYTGSGAVTVVDGLAGGVIISTSRPVGTVVGEAYWAKDKTPSVGVELNLYRSSGGYLEGQAIVDGEGNYQFGAVHECLNYYIEPAKPCYTYVSTSSSAGGSYTGGSFEVLATQLSDPEGDLAETYVSCIELLAAPCLDVVAPCLLSSSPKESEDVASLTPTITLTFSELIDESIPVKEEVMIKFDDVKVLTPPVIDFDFAWSTAQVDIEGMPTAQTVSVLTLTPLQDLIAGAKYSIVLGANSGAGIGLDYSFKDLEGNAYAYNSPVCKNPDVAGSDKLIKFTTQYGGTCPTVSNLAQLDLSANSVNADYDTPLAYLDVDTGVGGVQYPILNQLNWNPDADTASEYQTRQAVITWTAPGSVSDPVRVKGYRVYARVNSMDPWTRVTTTDLGAYETQWPAEGAWAVGTITAINTQLTAGNIQTAKYTNWEKAQTLQLAVTTVSADGYECPEITSDNSVTLEDNTAPLIVRNNSFSSDRTKWGELATRYFYNKAGAGTMNDTLTLGSMVYPNPSTDPRKWGTSLLACVYGDVPLAVPILEDIDATLAIPTTLTITDTSTTAANGICQLTFCPGFFTEPNDASDGAVAQRKMLNVKDKVYLVWNNAYKIDTGDRLYITGLTDLNGNVSSDWVHVVDDIPVMMKSVSVDPVLDTITVVTTEKVYDDSTTNLTTQNISRFMRGTGAWPAAIQLQGLAAGNPAGKPRLIDPDTDGNYNEHFAIAAVTGDVDASSLTVKLDDVSYIQEGDWIQFDAMQDDAWKNNTRAHNFSFDMGTQAYWYRDPNHPGAYVPDTAGLGTRTGMLDNIGPRLGGRNWTAPATIGPDAPYNSALTLPIKRALTVFDLTNLTFTENLYTSGAGTPADSDYNNLLNYQVRITDCGNDGICGGASLDDTLAAATVTAITATTNTWEFTLTCQTPNIAHVYMLQAPGNSITVTRVVDTTPLHNAISTHNTISYVAAAAPNSAHWVRN